MPSPDPSNANIAPETDTPPVEDGNWSERNYRALKISVIVMSVLLVLGLIVVFATIVNRVVNSGSTTDAPPLAIGMPADIAELLGADGEVVSTVLDGSRLAIVLKHPKGHSVIVIDLRSGKVLNTISGDTSPR